MKTILSTLILLLTTLTVQAQTFYELQFTHPTDGRKYLGLMTYFSDNHCKMRIVRADMGAKGAVHESEYTKTVEPKTRETSMGLMYYIPKDGRSMPTLLWWWQDFRGEDMKPEPQVLYDMTNPDDIFDATSFKEKQLSEMTAAYIGQFYQTTDAEYKNLLAAAKKAGAQNKNEVASKGTDTPTLRLLMVANTEVSDIGIACQQDVKNITNELRNIARVLQIPYEQTIISETTFNKKNVAKAVEDFKPGKQDIAVFIYSGHGFRFQDQTDEYPCIDLSPSAYDKAIDNYVTMTDIYNAIAAKGARLTLVLSDCCNTKIGYEAPAVSVNTLFSRASNSLDTDKLRQLFLGSEGNVRATAASPGEASWCGVKGGFFLLSFIESLRYQISTLTPDKPSWDTLINLAINEARNKTNTNGVPHEQNGMKQVKTKSIRQ